MAERIQAWSTKGFGTKEEKEKLINSVPRKSNINLVAPVLNEEVAVDLHPKMSARDEHFRGYQELTGAALAAVSSTLSAILNDSEEPLEREEILENLSVATKALSELFYSLTQSRKVFLLGKYDKRVQKILKKVLPTAFLFGDNLKGLVESSKAMEKVSKELKPKPSQPRTNSLNWRSPTLRREVGRGGFNQQRNFTLRVPNQNNRLKAPAKRFYTQSQPQRRRP